MAAIVRIPFRYRAWFLKANEDEDSGEHEIKGYVKAPSEHEARDFLTRLIGKGGRTLTSLVIWQVPEVPEGAEDVVLLSRQPGEGGTIVEGPMGKATEKNKEEKKKEGDLEELPPPSIEIPEVTERHGFAALSCFEPLQRVFPRLADKAQRVQVYDLFTGNLPFNEE